MDNQQTEITIKRPDGSIEVLHTNTGYVLAYVATDKDGDEGVMLNVHQFPSYAMLPLIDGLHESAAKQARKELPSIVVDAIKRAIEAAQQN